MAQLNIKINLSLRPVLATREPPLTLQGNGLAFNVGSIPYRLVEGQVDLRLGHLHISLGSLESLTWHDWYRGAHLSSLWKLLGYPSPTPPFFLVSLLCTCKFLLTAMKSCV